MSIWKFMDYEGWIDCGEQTVGGEEQAEHECQVNGHPAEQRHGAFVQLAMTVGLIDGAQTLRECPGNRR